MNMTKKQLRQVVIDAAQILGKFDPLKYSQQYRESLTNAAMDLCAENKMRWELSDDGKITFTLE